MLVPIFSPHLLKQQCASTKRCQHFPMPAPGLLCSKLPRSTWPKRESCFSKSKCSLGSTT